MARTVPGLGQNPASEEIAEALGVMTGERGNSLDRAVTFRDLIDNGLVQTKAGVSKEDADPNKDLENPNDPNMAVPPKITGLEASGGFGRITLHWDNPGYANHAYVEIWKVDTENVGVAELAGTSRSRIWTDGGLAQATTWYYWVVAVSTSGVSGPFSDVAKGTTVYEPSYLIDKVEGELADTQVISDLNADVDKIEQDAYYLRVANNGEIAGFGVGFDGNTSSFILQADRFAVADPDDADNATFPFIVTDATGDGNMEVLMDGAYINRATIESAAIKELDVNQLTASDGTDAPDAIVADLLTENATITSAQIEEGAIESFHLGEGVIRTVNIGDAQVDTLQLREGSVALTDADVGYSASGDDSWHTAGSLYIPYDGFAKSVIVFFGGNQSMPDGSGQWSFKLWLNDVIIGGVEGLAVEDAPSSVAHAANVYSGTLELQWYGSVGKVDLKSAHLVHMAMKV